MPRVVMIVRQFHPWVGGTERQAQKLAAKLIGQGVDVRVVTGRWIRGTRRREVIDGISVFRNFTCWGMYGIKGLRKFGGYVYLLTLFWHLWRTRRDYDIIHVHMLNYPAFPAVLASRWFGKKSMVKMANSGRGSDIRRMERNEMLPGQRQMLPTILKADRFIAINRTIVDELRDSGVGDERIAVIPNGVDVEHVARRTRYAAGDPVTLVFVGRLVPNKGVDVLLPAFKRVVEANSQRRWRLVLLGDGQSRQALESATRDLGLADLVEFRGPVDDVPEQLGHADIFVLPSRNEGMSNALLEAMTHGLPCVATRIAGNVDVLDDRETGLLVPSEDEEALARALLELGEDEPLRRRLGEGARRCVEERYSIESVARRYRELYASLGGGRERDATEAEVVRKES